MTPQDVSVLVVHAADVVTALAATAQGRETVLRVTPPFHRRQRARIHVPASASTGTDPDRVPESASTGTDPDRVPESAGPDRSDAAVAVHVPARAFLEADAPAFPTAPETAPTPPEDPAYDVDEHHDQHETAVRAWRDEITAYLATEIRVPRPDGDALEYAVRYLGD